MISIPILKQIFIILDGFNNNMLGIILISCQHIEITLEIINATVTKPKAPCEPINGVRSKIDTIGNATVLIIVVKIVSNIVLYNIACKG